MKNNPNSFELSTGTVHHVITTDRSVYVSTTFSNSICNFYRTKGRESVLSSLRRHDLTFIPLTPSRFPAWRSAMMSHASGVRWGRQAFGSASHSLLVISLYLQKDWKWLKFSVNPPRQWETRLSPVKTSFYFFSIYIYSICPQGFLISGWYVVLNCPWWQAENKSDSHRF